MPPLALSDVAVVACLGDVLALAARFELLSGRLKPLGFPPTPSPPTLPPRTLPPMPPPGAPPDWRKDARLPEPPAVGVEGEGAPCCCPGDVCPVPGAVKGCLGEIPCFSGLDDLSCGLAARVELSSEIAAPAPAEGAVLLAEADEPG